MRTIKSLLENVLQPTLFEMCFNIFYLTKDFKFFKFCRLHFKQTNKKSFIVCKLLGKFLIKVFYQIKTKIVRMSFLEKCFFLNLFLFKKLLLRIHVRLIVIVFLYLIFFFPFIMIMASELPFHHHNDDFFSFFLLFHFIMTTIFFPSPSFFYSLSFSSKSFFLSFLNSFSSNL